MWSMQQASQPLSGSAVLRRWFRDFATSMGIGAVLLVPILIVRALAEEGPTRCTIGVSWGTDAEAGSLPADDGQLELWAAALPYIEKARFMRQETEGIIWLELKFDADWTSDGDSGAGVKPPLAAFAERYEAQLLECGYGRPTAKHKSSQSPFTIHIGVLGWIMNCFLLASVGFLIRGKRSWVLRGQETAGSLGSPATTGKCLLWGAGLGVVFFFLGYASFTVTGNPVPHGVFYFWAFFAHPILQLIVGILAVTVVSLGQELFLRHHLYARMHAAGRGVQGALLSSCLPALFLVAMPLGAVLLFCQGLVCCWLYRRTGRLLTPLLVTCTATAGFFALILGLPFDLDTTLQGLMDRTLQQI